jgi:hypothetical protein
MLTGMRLRYDEIEDRIVLKTTKHEAGVDTELSLLITRRACISWRADMMVMAEIAQREPQSVFRQPGAVVRKVSTSASGNVAAASASTMPKQGDADSAVPAPARQLLVTAIECARRRADGSWLVKFKLKDHPMLTLVLSDDSLRRTASGLDKLLPRCNWGLPPVKVAAVKKTAGHSGSLH